MIVQLSGACSGLPGAPIPTPAHDVRPTAASAPAPRVARTRVNLDRAIGASSARAFALRARSGYWSVGGAPRRRRLEARDLLAQGPELVEDALVDRLVLLDRLVERRD